MKLTKLELQNIVKAEVKKVLAARETVSFRRSGLRVESSLTEDITEALKVVSFDISEALDLIVDAVKEILQDPPYRNIAAQVKALMRKFDCDYTRMGTNGFNHLTDDEVVEIGEKLLSILK